MRALITGCSAESTRRFISRSISGFPDERRLSWYLQIPAQLRFLGESPLPMTASNQPDTEPTERIGCTDDEATNATEAVDSSNSKRLACNASSPCGVAERDARI